MATSWKVWLSSFHSIGYSFITQTPFEIYEKTPLYITLGYDPLFNAKQEKNIPPGWRKTPRDVIPQLSAALYDAVVMW